MKDTLEYLYGLTRFGMKLGLEATRDLLNVLGNPQNSYKTIHVAGTNGKGSTCAYLASILEHQGYKTGLYTSPHLVRFNERIRVNWTEIPDEDLISLTEFIREKIQGTDLQPTFFEFTTALAFLYFAQQKVDIAVIEVGLGGRLDATNVITPLVSVITNIDFDHMEHLGDTLLKIASEKAGIIKSGVPLVTGETRDELLSYFRSVCKERSTKIHVVKDLLRIQSIRSTVDKTSFSIQGTCQGTYAVPLPGEHQARNAATALLAAHVAQECGLELSKSALKNGLKHAKWPGRIEVVSQRPLIIVDGAHNVAGMRTLHDFILTVPRRKVLVLAMAKDKEHEKMAALIVPMFERVIVTQGNFKPADISYLSHVVRKYSKDVEEVPNVKDAIERARSYVEPDDTILFTGSLYMIGDALALLK